MGLRFSEEEKNEFEKKEKMVNAVRRDRIIENSGIPGGIKKYSY